jgi:hypothetical protein
LSPWNFQKDLVYVYVAFYVVYIKIIQQQLLLQLW